MLAGLARPATTGLVLVGAILLCGLRLPAAAERTLAFEAFGFVEGVLALLVLFLFLRQGILPTPAGGFDRLLLLYWLAATAVLLRVALPPPGLGYWIGTAILAAVLLGAFGGGDRRRSLFTLGIAVAACGVVRFGVIPFVWRNAALPDLGPIELSGLSDWAKGLVTDYQPVRPGNEILNVLGIALYALAIWRLWPATGPDPLAGLTGEERDRLLRVLIGRRLEETRALGGSVADDVPRLPPVPPPPPAERTLPPAPSPASDERSGGVPVRRGYEPPDGPPR